MGDYCITVVTKQDPCLLSLSIKLVVCSRGMAWHAIEERLVFSLYPRGDDQHLSSVNGVYFPEVMFFFS